jgi:hypothetical protein
LNAQRGAKVAQKSQKFKSKNSALQPACQQSPGVDVWHPSTFEIWTSFAISAPLLSPYMRSKPKKPRNMPNVQVDQQ